MNSFMQSIQFNVPYLYLSQRKALPPVLVEMKMLCAELSMQYCGTVHLTMHLSRADVIVVVLP